MDRAFRGWKCVIAANQGWLYNSGCKLAVGRDGFLAIRTMPLINTLNNLSCNGRGRRIGIMLAAMLAGMFSQVSAADIPPPPRERAEQLTFDPVQNRWIRAAEPVPGTENGDLDIARQWLAREDYKTARKALKKWIKNYGFDSPRYAEALYLYGTAELELGDYRAADKAYEELLNDYPGSPYAERSLSGRFRIAEQYLAGKRRKAMGGLLRIKDRDGGVEIMDDMIVNYADTPLAEQAQLAKADYYYERGEFELAEDEYARFAREFPRSRYQAKALLWSAYAALASFPGIEFDDISLLAARERFVQFLQTYPDQAQQFDVPVLLEQIANTRADKTYSIARFYERTETSQAARYYYRAIIERWPDAPAAAEARLRLTAMDANIPDTEVSLKTVDIAGSNESRPLGPGRLN